MHVLRSYEGWPDFRRRIGDALDAYIEVTGERPIQRIGMRYINRIVIEGEVLELAHYFRVGPLTPANLPIRVSDLFIRTGGVVPDEHGTRTNLILASVDDDAATHATFILDIDVFREYGNEGLAFGELWFHVDDVRDIERSAFEGIIEDSLRKQFREVEHVNKD